MCPARSCQVLSCPALLCPALPCSALPCPALLCSVPAPALPLCRVSPGGAGLTFLSAQTCIISNRIHRLVTVSGTDAPVGCMFALRHLLKRQDGHQFLRERSTGQSSVPADQTHRQTNGSNVSGTRISSGALRDEILCVFH